TIALSRSNPMGTVRRLVVCFGLALALGALHLAARAGDDKGAKRERPRSDVRERFGQLLSPEVEEKLKLTGDQKEKVAKLQKDFTDKRKDALDKLRDGFDKARAAVQKARQDKDRDAMRQALQDMRTQYQDFQKLRDEFDTKLTALLTDDQKKQFDEL